MFRQEGVATETAGQYEEHELARMVAPLLFSFSDQDASPTIVARVGNRAHSEGVSQVLFFFSKIIFVTFFCLFIFSTATYFTKEK